MTNQPAQFEPTWTFTVLQDMAGKRLDAFLACQLSQFSRVQLRRVIQEGAAHVDDVVQKPSFRVRVGQEVTVGAIEQAQDGPTPENIPLEILYEDEFYVAVQKPPAMVVHPARGNWKGTLTNALAHRFQELSDVGGGHRPGIVHRLDRDTSGVIVVAKTNQAHNGLAELFEQRKIEKEYVAFVAAEPDRDADRIEQPIGPHPYQREKMAIRHSHPNSRPAESFFQVLARYHGFAKLAVFPKTGRTHQIRVHLTHIGCPVLCDRLYGGRSQITEHEISGNQESTVVLDRQALHARRIAFVHPLTGKSLEIVGPLPDDLSALELALQTRVG